MSNLEEPQWIGSIDVLDTTLRDGSQREGISFSVADKLRIAQRLDNLGVAYIEGGWPGANPKDTAFFEKVPELELHTSKVVAFGSTRRAGVAVENDPNVTALLNSGAPVVTVVGKSSRMHVETVLQTTLDENLAMIRDTISYLRAHGLEVLFDCEHFFDGYLLDADYALDTCRAAVEAGANCVVLCDTNGGALPSQVYRIVTQVLRALPGAAIGMHAHNDSGMADANTLAAVEAGATHVQGTVNGYGERCGNANLCTVIPNLELKMGYKALANGSLATLAEVSRFVAEVANLRPDDYAPYVGRSAFAHKAGLHVNALLKSPETYQHVDPALVGNSMRVLVSELSGRANIAHKLSELDLGVKLTPEEIAKIAQRLKELEGAGFQYEGAEGSFELLVRRSRPDYKPPFEVLDFMVLVEKRAGLDVLAEATVKLRVNSTVIHTASEGDGPVNALDNALRKAILPFYPELERVQLSDYKVRILDEKAATAARTRVLIEASDGERSWATVGCSDNIIEASFQALLDSLELPLLGRPSQ